MAQRRMFSNRITNSARFIKMPLSSQALYFHLGLHADDDGVVEAFSIMRQTGAVEDDLRILVAKGFVSVLNDDLVTYITDWNENNKIRADRKVDSIYKDLLLKIMPTAELKQPKPRADTGKVTGRPMDNQWTAQVRLGKDRLGKDSKKNSCKSPTYNADNLNYKAAVYFWEKIQDVFPKAKKPNLQNWANDVRLMHEQDKRSYDEIKAVIDWVNQDDFWVGNILSPKKLRKQYDALTIQMTRKGKPKTAAYKNPTEISDDDLPF
ncbi:hypothetical protein [Latilactobacillus sakei]|uniref:hypothetical protein n=1 Tax=Latilactobacillus sakei TaxID=1599 RepID=UPI000689C8DB